MAFVPLGNPIFAFFTLLIPLALSIAIVRYRLWNIDVIISRTLVYGILTTSIVGIYALVLGVLGILLQLQGNTVIALPTIVETVAQALKLPYVAILLQQGDAYTIAASYGASLDAPLHLPLVYRREMVGELLLVSRTSGESFTTADRRLLNDLARQAGVAAHAVLLTVDLQRSRERLVTTREEERRRLRRDLHDGLGSQLASQTLLLAAVRKLLRNDPDAAEALLLKATTHAQEAITDIRHLVYALRPPSLDALGLVAALREQIAQYRASGVALSLDAPDPLPPLPAAVEVACYRIVQEALTNVLRHATPIPVSFVSPWPRRSL